MGRRVSDVGVAAAATSRIGRPSAETSQELDLLILKTAQRLFTQQGYAATSMEQIASSAGSGKQTIYRRYASKDVLFAAVIEEMTAQLNAAAATALGSHASPLAALRELCRARLDGVCAPEIIAILRVMIAEAERFPALVAAAVRGSKVSHDDAVRHLLISARDRGEIEFDDPVDQLGQALSWMFTGGPIQHALLGPNRYADAAERTAFFDTVWALFLHGVARKRKNVP